MTPLAARGRHRPTRARLAAFPVAFLVSFALAGLWATASPLFSGPDEPAQVLRSVSLVNGAILGQPTGGPGSPTTKVVVPGWLAGANSAPACFKGNPHIPAACEPAPSATGGSVVEQTYTGRYPPLYYAVVGWPSLVASRRLALYLMRLASAAASAVFLGGAICCARRSRNPGGLLSGIAVVATPMVFFLAGVVNPSGLEISAAICVWSAAVVASEDRPAGGPAPRSVLVWLATGGAVLANLRGLSVLWVLVIGLSVGAYAGKAKLRALAADPRFRIAVAVIASFGAVATAWVFGAGALLVKPTRNASQDLGAWLAVGLTLENVGSETVQMVGVFGWSDTYLPVAWYVLWLSLAAAVVGLGTTGGSRRQRLVLVSLGAGCVLVPSALALSRVGTLGIFGQARDWMPMWVGLPILAGHSLSWDRRQSLRAGALACLGALQVLAWTWALRRYRSGSGHIALASPAAWSPPLPAPLLLSGVVVCSAAFALACWGPAPSRTASGGTPGTWQTT